MNDCMWMLVFFGALFGAPVAVFGLAALVKKMAEASRNADPEIQDAAARAMVITGLLGALDEDGPWE